MVGLFELFFFVLILIPVLILWIAALVDVLRNRFRDNDKLIWVLVVLFLPILGALLYFGIGSRQKIKED